MMVKVFGLVEAKRAGEFAKTDDQRRTVLAVVRMFGIPLEVEGQATRKIAAMGIAIEKNSAKIAKLGEKIAGIQSTRATNTALQSEALGLSKEWYFD